MITKRRREDKMATGLKKILFGIAGALVGAAGALYVTTTITKWSDGSKTRDDDSMIIYDHEVRSYCTGCYHRSLGSTYCYRDCYTSRTIEKLRLETVGQRPESHVE